MVLFNEALKSKQALVVDDAKAKEVWIPCEYNFLTRAVFLNSVKRKRIASLSTDITFLAVDLKFSGNMVKILGFRDGHTAGFRTYDDVFEKGKIWKLFWKYLGLFGLPIWYVGPKPIKVTKDVFSHNDKDRLAYDFFLKMGGRQVEDLEALERDRRFNKVRRKYANKKVKAGCGLMSDYSGVLFLKDRDVFIPEIEYFKEQYPGFLFVNERSRKYSNNKHALQNLFKDPILNQYRPMHKIYPKKYDKDLVKKIIKDFECERYVIKPINSTKGNGVIVVSRDDLDFTLKKILCIDEEEDKKDQLKSPLTYDYWDGDENSSFVVEEYVASKQISVNGEIYDPTMRIVCMLCCNDEDFWVDFLEGFWRLPLKPVSVQSSLTERHVACYKNDLWYMHPNDLRISLQDMKIVQKCLRSIFSKVYPKMLRHK